MNFGKIITPETPEEIAEYAEYEKRKKNREKEQKTIFVETGKIELNIRVPNIHLDLVRLIIRDVQFALENSTKLNLLNEFVITRTVEYREEVN